MMYQLNYSNQTNLLPQSNEENIQSVHYIRSNTKDVTACFRSERDIIGYKYQKSTATWKQYWNETVFKEANYPLDRYPWLLTNTLLPDADVIVLKHPDGIRFYQTDAIKPGLKLLKEDGNFHDVFGYTLLLGSFYPDKGYIGALTRDRKGHIQFYAASKESFLPDTNDPLFPLQKELSLTPIWRSIESDLFVAKILHNHQEAIGLRSPDGLEIYQVNAEYSLEKIVQTKQITKPLKKDLDRIYFADLTHKKYRDILHLNNSGLFVYQYHDRDYKCLDHNTEFTLSNGWLPHYTDSITLIDINGDKRDDIIFTGPQGIAALTFDSTSRNWKALLNSDQFSGLKQFATVIGSTSALPPVLRQPSIFTQDVAGKVQWAKIVRKPRITNRKKPTTTQTLASTPYPTPILNQIEQKREILAPKQIARTSLSEKPVLRWLEQWSDKFLKEAVDVASGQVHLKIPLIDISATSSWGLKLSISYDSRSTTTDVLGIGWSLPLTEDYIFVEYQGSTNPENTRYILMVQGIPHLLKPIQTEKGIQRFQLDGEDKNQGITIQYDSAKEQWIIEGDEEKNIYGKAGHERAQDAFWLSLSWPNWVGPGRDETQLQSLIMAWYLNTRYDKNNQQALFYYYEIDSSKLPGDKLYTSALHLKTITDNKEIRVTFKYSRKTNSEYTTPNPVDDEGNIVFPVPLVQNQYLQGYIVSTSTYSQELKFVYKLENETRFLTAITQQLLSYNDPVMQFSYQNLLGKHVLKSCRLVPRGSTFNFRYESITPPIPSIFPHKMNIFPVKEKCKLLYGPDYTVMTFKDDTSAVHKVIARIMNRQMTQTYYDSIVLDSSLINPTQNLQIKDYLIYTFQNSFVILIRTDDNGALCIFNRDSKQKWSTKPILYNFSKKTLIRVGQTMIVVADPDKKKMMLLEQGNNEFGWKEKTFSLSKTITFLAIHKRLIVGYDDSLLWLLHRSTQSKNWQTKVLESRLPGLAAMNRNTQSRFDWTPATVEQISSVLERNGLQIFNNFILLSCLQEDNGVLFLHIHLFLLNSENSVVKKKSFKIERTNLDEISYKFNSTNGNTLHIGYVKKSGKYKVRVKYVSGKSIDDISNKNVREDEREKQKKMVNHDPKFIEIAKESNFLDRNLYSIQMRYGAYCGNDIILRMTGTDWVQETVSQTVQSVPLGQHFILKAHDKNQLLYELYRQDINGNKVGSSIKQFQLHSPEKLVNRYPAYIAYQTEPNLVKILTFQDEKTLGQIHTFRDEELLLESDLHNLITISNTTASTRLPLEKYECKVRPLSILIPSKPQLFVNQLMLTDGNIKRLTGYRHSFTNNIQNGTYIESVSMIPGDDKNAYGWHEAVRYHHLSSGNITKAEHWFNANGEEVLMPPKEKTEEQISNKTSEFNKGLVFDRSGRWLISDFSPYNITDEMTAYYGFESYEKNLISNGGEKNVTKIWHFNDADVIRGKFAFTGESFLQLTNSSVLEGVLKPRDQETTYLIACWIRCNTPLTVDTSVSYLKAVINTTDGVETIVLLGQTKHQIDDWFYLELRVDFRSVKQIYQNYLNSSASLNNENTILPAVNNVTFLITVRVEVPIGQTVDLDHVRFFPLSYDFQAMIYHQTGICTAVIQANGLVIRNIHNRLQQDISNTDEEGRVMQFLSTSKTGKLTPTPKGKVLNTYSNILSFLPESGFHETFDLYALRNRWQVDSPHAWQIASGQLWHKQIEKHGITPKTHLFDSRSAAIRLYFALQKSQSSLSFHRNKSNTFEFIRQPDGFAKLILSNNVISPLPSAGELIIMLDQNYAWLWFDGVLLIDQELPMSEIAAKKFTPWSSFKIDVQGEVLLEDLLVMNRPQVKVEYYNAFGEKIQVIQLEDTKTALVTETLYDAIGRDAIVTKTTRICRKAGHPILSYHADFVRNKNHFDLKSVWYTGKLHGEVDRLNPTDLGVAYTRTKYAPSPLSQPAVLGLPGPQFSVTGRYATKMSQSSDIAFLDNIFPTSHGYRQRVEHTPNGSLKVTVFDKSDNQVAIYARVPSYNHLLSTYEYDTKNRLIKILPPLYHEKVNTAIRTKIWQPGEDHLSFEEKHWQRAFATSFIYDKYDRLTRKTTPDGGVTDYIYNAKTQLRFVVTLNPTQQPISIIYYNYDKNGQLSSTGHFTKPLLPIQNLQKLTETENLPNIIKFQDFRYADDHLDPLLRNRIKFCITYNDQAEQIIDKLQFNSEEEIVAKSTTTASTQDKIDQLDEIKKTYLNNKIHILTYPIYVNSKPLSIVHKYNKLGQLIALDANDEQNQYATFSYHASGELASENYLHNQYGFTRKYHYNSPGFLTQITDPFLTEELTYTEKGYGQIGYSGMVMQTAFNASWPINSDGRWFQFHENELETDYPKICLGALERMGYLTARNKPIKLYIPDAETMLPLVCGGKTSRNIARLLAEKQTPKYYGHRYAYGNHQELVKAKYFTEDTELLVEPLQPDSFTKEISNITIHHSRMIWHLLVKGDYINTDQQRTDPTTAIGKRGRSIFRSMDLYNDLIALDNSYAVYVQPIEQLITSLISKQRRISLTDFERIFFHWKGLDDTSSILDKNQQKPIATKIARMLLNKGYLPTKKAVFSGALDKNFINILRDYSSLIPQIVGILSKYFRNSLGETPFDVESYDIDANGNHRLFYTGFNRYELSYSHSTNKIQSVKLMSPTASEADKIFSMLHDEQGNVIRALHKGIQSIEYHPVSQRTTSIKLIDGRILRFYYDAQGERVLKRVFNAEGQISHETHYVHDEQGRVLVDRHIKYLPEGTQEIVTAYLYGPRGLLGFFRNNNFYGVTTDHAGSVRLIIEKGKVVAAYDYLPYGQLMRSYGNDPRTQINYRYTGQEWDEETGLYNYHARLYDPSIGRFYQPDPKSQYFSPYKYAGNSPISTVDPDGEFAFLLFCLILGGAYLGGAAANNRWNPIDWNFNDSKTYTGLIGGAIIGGLLPVGFSGSLATIGMGVGAAYVGGAATNLNWNPLEWQWDRPHTWNGLFQGFAAGSGITGGVKSLHNFVNTGKALSASGDVTKAIFLGTSYTVAGGGLTAAGMFWNNGSFAFWQWDWSNPAMWSSLIDGFLIGMESPHNLVEIGRGMSKLKFCRVASDLGKPSKITKLKTIMKNPKHPLYKSTGSAIMAYFKGSVANSEFDITLWDLSSFATYETVLNGMFLGKGISSLLQSARRSRTKLSSNSPTPTYKNRGKRWAESINLGHQAFMEESIFSSDKIRHETFELLRDGSLLQDAAKKFTGGEIQLPEKLQNVILQLKKKMYRSPQEQKLIGWLKEEIESIKQRETDLPFIKYNSISSRKRIKNISNTSSTSVEKDQNKAETIEQLFDKTDPESQSTTVEDEVLQSIDSRDKGNSITGLDPRKNIPTHYASSQPDLFKNIILESQSLVFNKTSNIEQERERSLYKTKENKNISTKHGVINKDINNIASSGASARLQFWPFSLIKSISFIISSNMPTDWISNICSKKDHLSSNRLPLLQPDLSMNHQPPLEHNKVATPSLLEMGDQLYQQSDIHGLLNLGILLIRKWTGYKQKSSSYEVFDDMGRNIKLDIQSTTVVDKFINIMLEYGQLCGISSHISDILEDSKLYYSIVKIIREKLAKGEFDEIPHLLNHKLVQNNIKKIESKSSREQIDKFIAMLNDYIPILEQELFECDQNWLLNYENINKMPTQIINNNKKQDKVDTFNKTISMTQKFLSECSPSTTNFTSMNNIEIFRK